MPPRARRAPIGRRVARALEVALATRVSPDRDAALLELARTLAGTLDAAVKAGASPNAIAAVSKEYAAVLDRLGLSPARREVSTDGRDPFEQLLADLAGGPKVGDPA